VNYLTIDKSNNINLNNQMNKLVVFCLLIFWVVSCKPAPEEAQKYHEALIIHKIKASDAFLTLKKTLQDTVWENTDAELENFKETLHDEIYAIKNQPTFDDKSDYRTTILNYLLELKSLGDHEVTDYLEYMQTPEEELVDKDRKYLAKIKPLIQEKYNIAEEHLQHGQAIFSEAYGITIKN